MGIGRAESGAGDCILLTGMMGCGKSSVGRVIAQRNGLRFIDTDTEIEARAGRRVSEIFAVEGEPRFRELEREALRALPQSGAVVALGGGAVVAAENRAILATKGTLVWLDASPETLASRTAGDTARPLLAGLDPTARIERLRSLAESRRDAYAHAAVRIDTDAHTTLEVADAVTAALGIG